MNRPIRVQASRRPRPLPLKRPGPRPPYHWYFNHPFRGQQPTVEAREYSTSHQVDHDLKTGAVKPSYLGDAKKWISIGQDGFSVINYCQVDVWTTRRSSC
jgi:hypothetical protein